MIYETYCLILKHCKVNRNTTTLKGHLSEDEFGVKMGHKLGFGRAFRMNFKK